MEIVKINGYEWQKTVGEEGQDVYVAQFKNNCEHQLGTFMEDTDYEFVINSDADFYAAPTCDVLTQQSCSRECANCLTEDHILFKLRKDRFTKEEQLGAYEGLVNAAHMTENRGLATGPKAAKLGTRDWATDEHVEILEVFANQTETVFEESVEEQIAAIRKRWDGKESTRSSVWLTKEIEDDGHEYDGFFWNIGLPKLLDMNKEEASEYAQYMLENYISDTTYANRVRSGIAGYYDRYVRFPYGRPTNYTEENYETYIKCHPFMEKLASEFERLLPRRFRVQQECANRIDPRFRVAGEKTPFTTITVNKNFRTAAHRDAGDLHEGFSNLTVVAKEHSWSKGYLVLPEFRVAIDLSPGDVLMINNHAGIHGNTEILPPEGETLETMERISLVCYFREKMLELGSWEYESIRRQWVMDRRRNPDHPLQRKRWNGISPGMWESDEWRDYLIEKGGEAMCREYHPEYFKETNTLEEFF